MRLRPYQVLAKQESMAALESHRGTLVDLPTGMGKTVFFAALIGEIVVKGANTLVVAHTQELVDQAASTLRTMGIPVLVEMGKRKAEPAANGPEDVGGPDSGWSRTGRTDEPGTVIVASVQSMRRRLHKYDRDFFDLVVVDEAHRGVADTYLALYEHFRDAKLLGVTATPNRTDKRDLADVFESVAFVYQLRQAIEDGWLVPIRQAFAQSSLDLSEIRTRMGDFDERQLNAAMTGDAVLREVARETLDRSRGRQALIFCVSVAHAHMQAKVLQEEIERRWVEAGKEGPAPEGLVKALDGTANQTERETVVDGYRRGEVRFLCNCALFTEGFDAPATSMIVMARPTKSETLRAQMMGRGTRPSASLARSLGEMSRPTRLRAIQESDKTDVLILDFVGKVGKHEVVSSIDILDSEAPSAVLNLARGLLERGECDDILEALNRGQALVLQMERERHLEHVRQAGYHVQVDPFLALGLLDPGPDPYGQMVTARQAAHLESRGIKVDGAAMSRTQASALLDRIVQWQDERRPSYKQINRLVKAGLDPAILWGMKMPQAARLVGELASNNWKRPQDWDRRFAP